jgi:hypothetical protein
MPEENAERPLPITVLSLLLFIFGVFAFVGSVFMWGEGFILQTPRGADLAFPITDILVNAPASIVAAFGLWRLKRYGYLAGFFVAGFYIYASVYIFLEVIQGGPPYPAEIIVPQVLAVLVAVGLLIYPDRYRRLFP